MVMIVPTISKITSIVVDNNSNTKAIKAREEIMQVREVKVKIE